MASVPVDLESIESTSVTGSLDGDNPVAVVAAGVRTPPCYNCAWCCCCMAVQRPRSRRAYCPCCTRCTHACRRSKAQCYENCVATVPMHDRVMRCHLVVVLCLTVMALAQVASSQSGLDKCFQDTSALHMPVVAAPQDPTIGVVLAWALVPAVAWLAVGALYSTAFCHTARLNDKLRSATHKHCRTGAAVAVGLAFMLITIGLFFFTVPTSSLSTLGNALDFACPNGCLALCAYGVYVPAAWLGTFGGFVAAVVMVAAWRIMCGEGHCGANIPGR